MATQSIRAVSGFARHAWTVIAGLGALAVLLSLGAFLWGGTGERQTALGLILIHLLVVLIAVFGLRRGERWAWFALMLWPLWLIAERALGPIS